LEADDFDQAQDGIGQTPRRRFFTNPLTRNGGL
jgi:hypothetical protein